jgi:hypothetical protein
VALGESLPGVAIFPASFYYLHPSASSSVKEWPVASQSIPRHARAYLRVTSTTLHGFTSYLPHFYFDRKTRVLRPLDNAVVL